MPTYTNGTSAQINAPVDDNGRKFEIIFAAGQTRAIEYVLDASGLGLTEDDLSPNYNPLASAETHESTGPGDDKTTTIDLDTTREVSVVNPSAVLVTAYINEKTNTPGIPIIPGTNRLIACKQRIKSLIFEFAAAATIYVEQRK